MRKAQRFNEIRFMLIPKAIVYLEDNKEKYKSKLLSRKEDQNRLRMERKDKPSLPKTVKGRIGMEDRKERNLDVRVDKKSTSKPSFLNLGFKRKEKKNKQ